jgi:hypothetical protein
MKQPCGTYLPQGADRAVLLEDLMAISKELRAIHYFSRSPFRSVSFATCTSILAVFLVWAFYLEAVAQNLNRSGLSDTFLVLALFALIPWIYSLFLHWEIRILVETADTHPAPRLVRLHLGLVQAPTFMAIWIALNATKWHLGLH